MNNERKRERMLLILKALSTPKALSELPQYVPTTCLSEMLAELKGAGLILYNQTTRKLEAIKIEVM